MAPRVLFLHHQQRRHFTEEPGYNEIYRVFKAAGVAMETHEFVYQTILRQYGAFEFAALGGDAPSPEGERRAHAAWIAANEKILPVLDQVFTIARPDVVLNIVSGPWMSLHPALFAELRRLGHRFKVASMHWDFEEAAPSALDYMALALAHCDRLVIPDTWFGYERLRDGVGPFAAMDHRERALFLPLTVDPGLFRPTGAPKTRDVAIFGSSEGLRIGFIRALATLYGARFAHLGGYMPDDEFLPFEAYVDEINATRVVVNTQTYAHRDAIKGRTKEVLAAGACLIEQDGPNTRRFLAGSPVPLFTDLGGLTALIDHFLADDPAREAQGAAGRAWYWERHSPRAYVETLLAALGV